MAKKIEEFGKFLHGKILDRKKTNKTFTFKKVTDKITKKNGENPKPATLTGMLKGDQEMLFRYVHQIIGELGIAIYLDGEKFFEVPENLNIEQLLKNSKTCKEFLKVAGEHHRGHKNGESKKKHLHIIQKRNNIIFIDFTKR